MAIECTPYFSGYKLQCSISGTSKIEHVIFLNIFYNIAKSHANLRPLHI